eukprot:3686878-Rhodomonas_salina.1
MESWCSAHRATSVHTCVLSMCTRVFWACALACCVLTGPGSACRWMRCGLPSRPSTPSVPAAWRARCTCARPTRARTLSERRREVPEGYERERIDGERRKRAFRSAAGRMRWGEWTEEEGRLCECVLSV